MNNTYKITERNQSVECCRLFCSAIVIFLHIPLPKILASEITLLARFTVPFFFMISGYYAFGTGYETRVRRVKTLVKLNIVSTLLYLLWDIVPLLQHQGAAINYITVNYIKWKVLVELVAFHVNPLSGHLWYLLALLWCWFLFMVYPEKRKGYGFLYYLSILLLAAFFVLSTGVFLGRRYFDNLIYRNGYLMGFPIFMIGVFLKEYKEKINFKTWHLWVVFGIGLLLSIWQWRILGEGEMPMGMLLSVAAVILLLQKQPVCPIHWIQSKLRYFGKVSTVVYMIHMLIVYFYVKYMQGAIQVRLGVWEEWIQPLAVLVLSFFVAILWAQLSCCLQNVHNKVIQLRNK